MGNTLGKSAAIDFGIQWSCWIVASLLKTEKFYDLAGSGTAVLLTALSLHWNQEKILRQKIQSGMVIAWGLRLGLFLFTRVLKAGKDRRFNNVRDHPLRFFVYWTIQGIWLMAILLPTLILNSKTGDQPLTIKEYTGWSLWGIGFLLEALADHQKTRFHNNPENQGKFITSGLWSIVRHPNYLGEILLWSGLYVSASSYLSGWERASVISPVLTALLLTKVRGIPLLEKSGMRRWGEDPQYLKYLKETPKLIPFLW